MRDRPKYQRVTKKMRAWLTAYAHKACNVSEACQAIKNTRQTISNWTRGCPAFARLREEVEESLIDKAEGKLLKLINADNLTAIIFFLKCKAKHRGYVEKLEQTHEHGGTISLDIHKTILRKLSDDTDSDSDS